MVQVTYPGVYIEEIPSGVRTITGVATSITAFIGQAIRGPVHQAFRIQSFADFERTFGGLSKDSTMSYAVRQFFQHGGSDALIGRVVNGGARAQVELATAGGGSLVIEAVESGAAGNSLRITIDHTNVSDGNFNLTVLDSEGAILGTLVDVPIGNLVTELTSSADLSALVRVGVGDLPSERPDLVENAPLTGGQEAAAVSRLRLPASNAAGDDAEVVLVSANPGSWGNNLQAIVDHVVADGLDDTHFNLSVQLVNRDDQVVEQELFRNVSVSSSALRFVTDVIKSGSNLVRVDESAPMPAWRPDDNIDADSDGLIDPTPVDDANSADLGLDGDTPTEADYTGSPADKTGLYALEKADLFNLLCIPPITRAEGDDIGNALWAEAHTYCKTRRAMLVVDNPSTWNSIATAETGVDTLRGELGGAQATNAALYFPRLRVPDPLNENRLTDVVSCGAVAGIMARTDSQRGVWKAPAGLEASLSGVPELTLSMTDGENGRLNPLGVNCLRTFPVSGTVVWGSRTFAGADRLASEWKYVPVRRIALFIEESLYRGTQWVVFEPNDEPLWAQIRLNIGAFMQNLFRQGAFQGRSPREAYFVKCDRETTTQNDINLGIVNILVGFAPLKPAEFVVIKIQQMAGQIET